jgi:hypothetical protein
MKKSTKKLKIFVAESVSEKDFYHRRWEGRVIEEIVRLLGSRTIYRIAMTRKLFAKAVRLAARNKCDVFHLSCHGDKTGIELTDGTELSWEELAEAFQEVDHMPAALIMSSCVGGNAGIARAFEKHKRRPDVIFGTEGKDGKELTFSSACICWPILYKDLVKRGIGPKVFKGAVDKMNRLTRHQFVYRRWDEEYRRYPRRNRTH